MRLPRRKGSGQRAFGEESVHQYMVWIVIVVVVTSLVWGAVKLRDRFEILGEFLVFLRERKMWWIMPLVIVFALVGLLVVITSQSAIGTFIYTLW
jgi:hypothetical protein